MSAKDDGDGIDWKWTTLGTVLMICLAASFMFAVFTIRSCNEQGEVQRTERLKLTQKMHCDFNSNYRIMTCSPKE